MADDLSSDDIDRPTNRAKTRKCNCRKQRVSTQCVPRYKVPGKITIPGTVLFFNYSQFLFLNGAHTDHNTHCKETWQFSAEWFQLITRHMDDNKVIRLLLSYYMAYQITNDNIFKRKIQHCPTYIYELKYYNAVASTMKHLMYLIAASEGHYNKGHVLLQDALNCVQNVAPGACTAVAYTSLAEMYEQLAYLMPHRMTTHLQSALHMHSVAREHFRCEGDETGDWEVVNYQIAINTLYMINIKLGMPNYYQYTVKSRYGLLFARNYQNSGHRCNLIDQDISIARDMWDTIIKQPYILDDLFSEEDVKYPVECVVHLYMRQTQVKKQAMEYALALDDCVTAMRWYTKMNIRHEIKGHIGPLILDLFQEILRKLITSTVVKADDCDECYIDEAVLCYSRTTESSDDINWDRSDTSLDFTSQSESDDGKEPLLAERKSHESVEDDPKVKAMSDDISDAHQAVLLKLLQLYRDPSVCQFLFHIDIIDMVNNPYSPVYVGYAILKQLLFLMATLVYEIFRMNEYLNIRNLDKQNRDEKRENVCDTDCSIRQQGSEVDAESVTAIAAGNYTSLFNTNSRVAKEYGNKYHHEQKCRENSVAREFDNDTDVSTGFTYIGRNQTSYKSSDTNQSMDKPGDNNQPVPAKHQAKHDPTVDDLTDSSDLCESSPNEDSQDTEVMEGY